ncbi:MAG: hypothetical protein KatS3mg061_1799 [Dehalococcoidia bacterium]|nr:MAG: hypothetical protein KatS3mg061_1799 [Dehalococcoidia bacterium]
MIPLLGVLLLALVGCQPATAAPTLAPLGERSAAAQVAERAAWAPGELEAHYRKHPEGYTSVSDYDRGAREAIRVGRRFTYRDTQTGAPRVGYYDPATNRFTGLTGDERRITTHFRPDRGEAYVRGLPGSTYQ